MFVNNMDYQNEIRMVSNWRLFCNNLVSLFWDELDEDEILEWTLESSGACLLFSFGKLIKKYKDDGMYVPITNPPLIV